MMSANVRPWFEASDAPSSRPSRPKAARRPREAVPAAPQFELRMAPAAPPAPNLVMKAPRPALASPSPPPRPPRQTFGSWLLDQAKRSGSLGELAKAAKLDRQFPRNGSAEDVRRRFGAAGADGDAFEALDDAERAYDRQMS